MGRGIVCSSALLAVLDHSMATRKRRMGEHALYFIVLVYFGSRDAGALHHRCAPVFLVPAYTFHRISVLSFLGLCCWLSLLSIDRMWSVWAGGCWKQFSAFLFIVFSRYFFYLLFIALPLLRVAFAPSSSREPLALSSRSTTLVLLSTSTPTRRSLRKSPSSLPSVSATRSPDSSRYVFLFIITAGEGSSRNGGYRLFVCMCVYECPLPWLLGSGVDAARLSWCDFIGVKCCHFVFFTV